MYRCCNIRRFLILLVCDAVLLLVGVLLLRGGAEADTDGVFLPVIMYHSVFEDHSGAYSVSPNTLENDLAYLHTNGYHAVLAEDLISYVYEGMPLPPKPVMITFDDGFYNNLSKALPLLEQYDMKAVISVVGCFMDKQVGADSHNPAYSYLTTEDISALLDSGRVEIGNHTYGMHGGNGRRGCAKLLQESEAAYAEALQRDIGYLQTMLSNEVGISPVVFAYPYGYISRESISVLRRMGFLATMTCYERGNWITRDPDCLFGLCRYNRDSAVSTESFMRRALARPNES